MSNPHEPIKMDSAPASAGGGISLWKVKGRTYLQQPNDADNTSGIKETQRTYSVAVGTPHLAVAAFLRMASKECYSMQSIVRVEVESVEWVSRVDAAVAVG